MMDAVGKSTEGEYFYEVHDGNGNLYGDGITVQYIDGKTYGPYKKTSGVEAGSGLTITSDSVKWGGNPGAKGMRISFYIRLKDKYLHGSDGKVQTGVYPTNEAGDSLIEYTKQIKGQEPILVRTTFKTPAQIELARSVLTLTKSNDPAKDEEKLKPGEEIAYSFSISNDGELNVTDITVADSAPAGTVGSPYSQTASVNAGQTNTSLDAYTVKVDSDTTTNSNIANQASLTVLGKTGQSNQVENQLYTATGSITLGGTKELTGRAQKAGEFSFILRDAQGQQIGEEEVNAVDGTFWFAPISYKFNDLVSEPNAASGNFTREYTYFIEESSENLPANVTHDPARFEVKVTVADVGAGELSVTPVYTKITTTAAGGEGDAGSGEETGGETAGSQPQETREPVNSVSFVNHYTATGSATVLAKKTMTGRDPREGEFSFELKAIPNPAISLFSRGVPAETVQAEGLTATNAADGTVTFDVIDYNQDYSGENWYELRELGGDPGDGEAYKSAGVTGYDGRVYRVSINMVDDGVGLLTPEITYYAPDGNGGYAQLAPDEIPEFVNKYEASGTVQLRGTKTLSGRSFTAGDSFTFTIAGEEITAGGDSQPEGGNTQPEGGDTQPEGGDTQTGGEAPVPVPMPVDGEGNTLTEVTIQPDSANEAPFGFDIPFNETHIGKTYVYTILEKDTGLDYMKADDKEIKVSVQVSDRGDGNLDFAISATDDGAPTNELIFSNVYTAKGHGTAEIFKTLALREFWKGDKFTFTIEPVTADANAGALPAGPLPVNADGDEVKTVTIEPKSGSIAVVDFGQFPFTEADSGQTYLYVVKELQGDDRRMIYDPLPRHISITVTDDTKGTMVAAVSYPDGGDNATFNNEYIPPVDISIRKEWIFVGSRKHTPPVQVRLTRDKLTGEPDETYSVVVELNEGNGWYTVVADQDGNYIYHVQEMTQVLGFAPAITQDGTTFIVQNIWIPQTGDRNSLAFWAALVCISGAGIALLARRRRRQ